MPRKSKKKRADEIREIFVALNDGNRRKWQGTNQKSYDFSLGEHISEEDKTALREAGMPDFIINMITPSIQTMKYFITANNPRWMTVGTDGSDADKARMFAGVHDYIWHISAGKQIQSQVVTDIITKSKGYFLVYFDPDADGGMGEVMISWVPPFDVYEDMSARDLYGRDCSIKMIKKDLPRSQLILLLPKYENQIRRATGEHDFDYFTQRDVNLSDTIQPEDITKAVDPDNAEDEDILPYYEVYRRIQVPFVNVFINVPPTEGEIDKMNSEIEIIMQEFAEELKVDFAEKERELGQALQNGDIIQGRYDLEIEKLERAQEQALEDKRKMLISRGRDRITQVEQREVREEEFEIMAQSEEYRKHIVYFKKFYKPQITVEYCVGDQWLEEIELDERITEHPLISIPAIHTGTIHPISFIVPAIGKQEEINKAHQIMIHNANLSSNMRMLALEGSIDDEYWEKNATMPGSILFWRDLGLQGKEKPDFIQPLPLNNAFYSITEKGQSDIEYLMGMHPVSQGAGDQKTDTYRGLLAMDEYGTRRIRNWIDNVFEPGLELVGKVVQQFAQSYYSAHKVMRIVQPSGNDFNEQSTEINIPIYDDLGNQVGKFNDYQSCKYDIRIVAGSTMPINRWAILEEYFKWFQANIIDDIAFLQHTDITNKEEIIKRNSMYAKMKQQIDSMEDQIKQKEGDIETLMRQIIQLSIKAKEAGMVSEMRKEVQTTERDQEITRAKLKDKAETALKQLELDMEKMKLDKEKKDSLTKKEK